MELAARIGTWKGKPLPYDAEVEWLQSTLGGGQFIDSGIAASSGTTASVSFSVEYDFSPNDTIAIFGANNIPSNGFSLSAQNNGIAGITVRHGGTLLSKIRTEKGRRFNVNVEPERATIDGESYVVPSGGGYIDGSVLFFGLRRGVNVQTTTQWPLKIWSFSIDDRHFIPVKVGQVGCFYDLRGIGGMNGDGTPRTDGLYFNRGTGAFIIGPDRVAQLGGGV